MATEIKYLGEYLGYNTPVITRNQLWYILNEHNINTFAKDKSTLLVLRPLYTILDNQNHLKLIQDEFNIDLYYSFLHKKLGLENMPLLVSQKLKEWHYNIFNIEFFKFDYRFENFTQIEYICQGKKLKKGDLLKHPSFEMLFVADYSEFGVLEVNPLVGNYRMVTTTISQCKIVGNIADYENNIFF